MHQATFPRGARGVALLIVITILVSMVIIAVPFAVSQRQGQERTEAIAAQNRAEFEAGVLLDLAHFWLRRTHPEQEQQRLDRFSGVQGRLTDVTMDPRVDSLEEILPGGEFRRILTDLFASEWAKDPRAAGRLEHLRQRGLTPINDERGSIWSVQVEDAQGRVNVNGASPYLLGNLLGAALLQDDLDTGAGDIPVEHVTTGRFGGLAGFARDGGYVRIGGEVIQYDSFDGRTFRGCRRGALQAVPLRDNGPAQSHPRGTPVIDYAAWKLATHLIARRPGHLTGFRTLEDLRDISSWGEGGVLTAERLQPLLSFLTVWSRRETAGGWLTPQLVTNALPSTVDGAGPEEVHVRDLQNPVGTAYYLNPGTLVRVSDGRHTVYQTVAGVGDDDGRQRDRMVTLSGTVAVHEDPEVADAIAFTGGEATLAAWDRHPINVNTAPVEVLYAVLANVQLWRAKAQDAIVHPELAWSLAQRIAASRRGELKIEAGAEADSSTRISGPFRHATDWGRFLDTLVTESVLTRDQRAALYLNAITPNSSMLRFGTAPWCYRTLDVYHLESRVSINNRAGDELANASRREVVEIGSDDTAVWMLDSQTDFEERLAMGNGAKWTSTFPFSVAWKDAWHAHIQPGVRGPKQYVDGVYPSSAVGEDLGDVRLEPARVRLPGAVVEEHFDRSWYVEGHFTGYDGPHRRKVAGELKGRGDSLPRPFQMAFWWRCYSNADSWPLYDCGVEAATNRYAVFVAPGEDGPELVFRCAAGLLDEPGAEVFVPLQALDYQPGNWYHVQIACAGEDPSTMQLLVDGVDLARRRSFTWLAGELAADGTEVPVNHTAGFPVRGALRIGTEIIEYDLRQSGSFGECLRGARGTLADSYPAGTPVHLLGYSLPITVDVMPGGASNNETLRKWSAVRISSAQEPPPDTIAVLLEGMTTPLQLGGYGPDRRTMQVRTVGMWGQSDELGYEAFNSVGLALMGSPEIGNLAADGSGGVQIGGWEVVSYQRNGSSFTIERYQRTAWQGEAQPYFLATWNVSAAQELPAFLVPISVLAVGGQGASGYLDPALGADQEVLTRYYPDDDRSARVLLGTDTPEDNFEVIRYDSIDRQRGGSGILFVRDRNLGAITNHFFGQAQDIAGGSADVPDDPPPPPPDDPSDDPPPAPPPEPPPGDFEDPPSDPEDPPGGGFPTPGGGVPPGSRDVPTDPTPPPSDGGDDPAPAPGDGGTEPGTDDPGSPPPAGGGDFDDPADGGEPGGGLEEGGTDPREPGGSGEEGSGGGAFEDGEGDSDSGGGSASGPGGSGPGGGRPGEGGGALPPPEEPVEDGSGGGDFEPPGGDDPDDPNIPNQPAPGARDPSDPAAGGEPPSDTTGSGAVWEPAGPETARLLLQHRGVNGTYDQDHFGGASDRNSRFLPCFRVFEGFRGALVQRCGRNDKITLNDGAEGTPRRTLAGVRWGDANSDWCALEDFISERYAAPETGAATRRAEPRGRPRILKFPCGELPDELPEEMEFGTSRLAGSDTVTAFLDELTIWRQDVNAPLVLQATEGISEREPELRLGSTVTTTLGDLDGYDPACGVLMIEGEIVVYRGSHMEGETTLVLEDCARGAFGTRARPHAPGAPARFLPDLPVSYLSGTLPRDGASIPMARTAGWPTEGLVRIVGPEAVELVHYTRLGSEELVLPRSMDRDERSRDRGLFRGRFGTDAIDHDSGALVIWQPFRYWDRATVRRGEEGDPFSGVHDHPETSYLELGRRLQGAVWRGFTWTENLLGSMQAGGEASSAGGEGSGLLDIVVLARFSPHVPWDTRDVVDLRQEGGVARRPDLARLTASHLFVFDDVGDAPLRAGLAGNRLDVESDTAEFRILFVYKPNAYVSVEIEAPGSLLGDDERRLVNQWKRTPWLRSFAVAYENRTLTRWTAPLR